MKVIVKEYLNVRVGKPSVNAPTYQYLAPGSELEVDGILYKGDPYEGTDKWLKDGAGNYYWAGGVENNNAKNTNADVKLTDKKSWGFIDFEIDKLWEISKGKNITVAILDSGLNYDLDDFKDKKNITYYNVLKDSALQIDCRDDSFGHGTECAGILCAQGSRFFGVAPEINLLVIKITDETGGKTTTSILKGLEKAIELKSDIISLSFYIAQDENFEPIHNKIKEAYNKGITIVAAAGDSGSLQFPVDNYPASFPECLSIGGISRLRKRSRASTKSNFLDLMGPGEDLFSLLNPDVFLSGTSFSTPFIAGVIALLKSSAKTRNKELSNAQLYDILKRSADKNTYDSYNVIDYGWGILNPLSALNLVLT